MFRGLLEVFEKYTTVSLRKRDHRAYRVHNLYILVIFWSKKFEFLVRFLSKFGQIVNQILENSSQILIKSTLHKCRKVTEPNL